MRIIQSNGYTKLKRLSQDGTAEFGNAMQGLSNAVQTVWNATPIASDFLYNAIADIKNFLLPLKQKYPKWGNQYGGGVSFTRLMNGDLSEAPDILQSIINDPNFDQQTKEKANELLQNLQSAQQTQPSQPTQSSPTAAPAV